MTGAKHPGDAYEREIPELDPTEGGTRIGSSRDYVDPDDNSFSSYELLECSLARKLIEDSIGSYPFT